MGVTEDEMVGWHHWLNGHEFERAPGDGEGQGSLACCRPWGCKKSDRAKWRNNSSVILCLAFWKTARLFSTVAPLFLRFHRYRLRILFLQICTNTCPFFFVLFMAILYHSEVISYHGFYLHFLLKMVNICWCVGWHVVCLLRNNVCSDARSVLQLACFLLLISKQFAFMYSGY